MTEIQKINAEAKLAFEQEDYPLAFQTLWKVGVVNFVPYCEKEFKKPGAKTENWLTHPVGGKYFWNDFILQDDIFSDIFNSDSADQLLHTYFSKCNISAQKFEAILAEKYPQIFIKAIRVNQVFLKADRIGNLNLIQLGSEFQLHQKIWKKIFEIEQTQWKGIQDELNAVSQYSLNKILSQCIIWLETIRFTNDTTLSIHHLARVYGFFMELLLNEFPNKSKDLLGHDNFFKQFLKTFASAYKEKKIMEESPVSKLLHRISHWIHFKEHVISPYSFDLNIEPIQQNELVFFNSSPETYYKWHVNSLRYEVNQWYYHLIGNTFVEDLEKNELIKIPGKTEIDIQLNRDLAGTKWATLFLLSDMACESFQIGNNQIIETQKLLTPLLTYSFNRLHRYEQCLKTHAETSQSWSESLMKLILQSIKTDVLTEPFFLMTESEYKQLNKEALSEMPDSFTTEIVQLFSYRPNPKYTFNRFQQQYDVWQKPFSKIGNFLFCPMMFFANNMWFYSFAQAALLQKTLRSETKKMENYLGNLIKEKGWNVKVINDKESGEVEGDVDIFAEDSDTLLFIQLKRTYFRLDLKDAYYEAINTDLKAARQLNDAEKYLENPNSIYEIKHKPIKWIVSTSFENIGNKVNGCQKVNYFELLNALKNPEIKKLSDLLSELESDKNLKALLATIFNDETPIEFRQIVSEMAKPLALSESKHYKQVIFSDDEEKTEEYNSLYSEALKLDTDGKQNDSLVLLQKCISLNPNDGDALGAIANILADMKLFDGSFIAFKKALELLPNDPYISRNFSLALLQAKRYYDGLQLAVHLYETFPMLGDIKILFEKNFELCLKYGVLEQKQILELQTKWTNLN